MPSGKHDRSALVQELIAIPKGLGKSVSGSYQKDELQEEQSDFLQTVFRATNDTMQDIKENIIIPFFESKTDEYENKLSYYIIPFQSKIKSIIQKLEKMHFGLPIDYEFFRKPIEENRNIIPEEIGERVLLILDRILEHDRVLLEVDDERPELLEEILNIIDVADLQKNVYSSLLVFCCILYYYNENKNEQGRLSKLLEIGMNCSQVVEDYIHTISILYNPDDTKLNELVRKNVKMAVIIGNYLVSKLSDEFKKMNWGKFVAINYKGNIIKIADTLDDLNDYILYIGLKENYYVERLGYDAIAYM